MVSSIKNCYADRTAREKNRAKSPKMSLLFGFVLNFSFFFKQKSTDFDSFFFLNLNVF